MLRIAFLLIALQAAHCLAEEYLKEPKVTIDPDGEIPIEEIHGIGNVDVMEEDDVLILTRDNFQAVVRPKDLILVEFYAPWCGHCTQLAPEYAIAAKKLKEDGIPLGKVDATKETELSKEYLISGFPTLKLFKKGQPVEDFSGQRDAAGIIEYMKRHADPNYSPPPSAVDVLTTTNFTKYIKEKPLSLVEFYAPWCKHCKALEPEYEGAAAELKQYNIPLAKIDGPSERDLTDSYKVSGYPTLKVFRYGREFEYKGPRDHQGIVSHMREQAKLPSKEISIILDAQNSMARSDVTVFAHFLEKNDMFDEFINAANELRGRLVFLHTFSTDVAEKFGLETNSVTVIMPEIYYSPYEKKSYTYTKATATYKEIAEFISKQSIPLVGQRSKTNEGFKYQSRPLVIVYYDVNFSHQYVKDTQFIRKKIVEVANKHRDMIFCISDEEEYEDELEALGLGESGESVNVAIYDGLYRYPMEPEEDFSADVLEDFVQKYKKNKLKPHFKSQPVPKKQTGPIRVVVANNFEKEVLKTEKDVFIMFYAPWCGHCKKLNPVFKKLAKYLEVHNPDVTIAKMDATANDVHPAFKVSGFPTLYFVPAKDKDNPTLFSGERSLENLKDFIAQESTIFGDDEKEYEGGTKKDEL
ncbi:putative protein disulfide-isomerase A4 [Oratosquilla oratoria]|uniref:putative protein disulfide-isomerase A4 n=1 Tax=Oratosquilla oratoria TaxID=337810 RepID=UPI003F7645AE